MQIRIKFSVLKFWRCQSSTVSGNELWWLWQKETHKMWSENTSISGFAFQSLTSSANTCHQNNLPNAFWSYSVSHRKKICRRWKIQLRKWKLSLVSSLIRWLWMTIYKKHPHSCCPRSIGHRTSPSGSLRYGSAQRLSPNSEQQAASERLQLMFHFKNNPNVRIARIYLCMWGIWKRIRKEAATGHIVTQCSV